MEFTSTSLHKAQLFWRGFLLTVSLLTYWTSPTAALGITLEAVPLNVAVGNDVLLLAHNVPIDVYTFSWHKIIGRVGITIASYQKHWDSIRYKRDYTGMIEMFINKSLLIKNVSKDDPGDYRAAVVLGNQTSGLLKVKFHVYYPVTTPSIQVNKTIDKTLTSVFLKCLSIDINISIHWFFKGQSLRITNRMNLTENNSTLQIVPARREDSGDYQCEVSNPLGSKKSDPIQLDVVDPVTTPFIQVTNTTVKNLISVFLTCLSNDIGISIQWFFKGNILVITNRKKLFENNHTLQILPVRIEDSGDYQCEVFNEVSSKRSDPIQLDIIRERSRPKKHRPSSRGIIGIIAQCLMGLIAVIFVLFLLWRRRRGREPQIENNVKQVGNEPTNVNEPTNLNKTSKEGSNMKSQKKKKSKK
ncbi:cell adhesion molecule CEACAM1-like isoform X1 [Peromyscus maniculatus bairdii]|uniref:cell adhesion molecule CEACAM1-like isoform X1 n=1 Tax=Peromyscus maniculatus bairdii TaxID=230844 RepID=UPI003FCF1DA0